MDIRDALQNLGKELVLKYGFTRSNLVGKTKLANNTAMIEEFLIWLDNTPQAEKLLKEMGLILPVRR